MRCVTIAVLLAALGCATQAPPYTGVTFAQARWGAHIAFCRDYVARPGEKDQRIVDECRRSEAQAAAEDAAERQQLQAQRQEREDEAARDRRMAAAAILSAGLRQPVAPAPQPVPAVTCTSTPIGDTVWTNCR